MDEYVREFVQESEEEITELNNALLTLEQNPDDGEAMDRIFRTAHTLKGNAGAMGFDRAEALAHALEDLLDAIRRGAINVSPQLMDRVFDAVDELETLIGEIPDHGSPQTDPEAAIAMLREDVAAADRLREPTDAEIDDLLARSTAPNDERHNEFHVRLNVAEEREQHGMLVVEALEDAFDLLGTAPPEDEISDGAYGGNFDAVFASAVGEESISAALDPVDAVEGAIIEDVTDRTVPDESDETTVVGADEAAPDPEEMDIDDLLDEFSEYDDLDEMVEQVEDVEGFDDLGDAGSFDDIEVDTLDTLDEDPEVPEADDEAVEASTADSDDVEDAAETFRELQQEVEPVGFDELQAELDELEFDELDDDEVGFEELLGEDELGGDDPFAAGEFDDDPFGAGDGDDEPGVDELIEGVDESDDEVTEPDGTTADPTLDDVEAVEATDAEADAAEPADATADVTGSDGVDADAEVPADSADSPPSVSERDDEVEPVVDEAVDAMADDGVDTSGTDIGDEQFEDLLADDGAAEPDDSDAGVADLEDEAINDVDESGSSPDLDLEDPFADPDGDDEQFEEVDEAEDDETESTAVSEAGAFDDIDFGDPADPEAAPGELDDGGFGAADELDLSMDLDDTTGGGSDDQAESEAEWIPDDQAESESFDASAEGAEPSVGEDTTPSADDGSVSEAEPSDEAVEASLESIDVGSTTAEEDAEDRPSAAAGTGVDTETAQSIRVDVEQVDQLMNLVEGLVSTRARLRRAVDADEPRRVIDNEVDELDALTAELQDTVMDVRLVPLRNVVNKLPRLVRDISRDQDKQVTLDMAGEDVEVDRTILDEIGDPLMHVVRNAIDHGIEPPEEREAAGKDPGGTIELRARRERDTVAIEVEDDGRGIDVDELGDAAVEEGIIGRDDLLAMDDADVYELVFHPGFSTSDEVTDVSGRGVGMDVVASTVDRLDGDVTIDSEPGAGTTVRIEVPISLAISDVLFVESGGEEYGIPTRVVSEIGPSGAVTVEDGREVVERGETSYPLIRLDEALETPERGQNGDGMLVQIRDDVRPVAVHCDQVREQQEVVVKPFEGFIGDIPGLSGATVLGEGDVVNILDVETL